MPDILVPKSPVQGGRAAQITVPQNQTGAVAAAFGDKLTQIGGRLVAEQDNRNMARAQIEMTSALGELRLKYSQETDPDVISQNWEGETAGIRESVLSRYDDRMAERIVIAFDELNGRHTLALGAREIELRGDQSRAMTTTYGEAILQSSSVSDQATRDAMLMQFSDKLDGDVAAGYITREDAVGTLMSYGSDMEGVAASRLLTDNPQGLLNSLDEGEFAALDAQKRETYRTRALAAVESAANAAAAEETRAQNQRNTEIGDRLKDVRDIARTGRNHEGEIDFLADPLVQAHPDFAEAEAAVILRDGKPGFSHLNLAEMNAQIAEENARPVGEKFETRVLDAMIDVRDAAIAGWKADPYSHAVEIGLEPAAALPDMTTADPRALSVAFGERRAYALSLVENGYMDAPVFFSPEDKANLVALASVETNPEARASLAGSIAQGFGPEAVAVFTELGGDPVFAHVGGYLAHGGNPALASEIFVGQQAIEAKTVDMPSAAESRETVYAEVSNLFVGHDEVQSSIMQATDALYASRIRSSNSYDPNYSAKVYRQALHEVMGGTGKYNKSEARGGIQEVLDHETILPIGVSGEAVEAAIGRSVRRLKTSRLGGISDQGDVVAAEMKVWQSASLSGGFPSVNGRPISGADLDKVYLAADGNNAFALVYATDEGPLHIRDSKTGELFIFDLVKFLKEAGE